MDRISPDLITELKPNQVFVFGSNLIGKHGAGAARMALKFGAKPGVGVGRMGDSYGIPTKGHNMRHILRVDEIRKYVDDFILHAAGNPHEEFLVTEIGCGLAGYSPKDIAPLFKTAIAVQNIFLPRRFLHKLL